MAYTNSSLVSFTQLSPNHSGQRTHAIDRITPHCVVRFQNRAKSTTGPKAAPKPAQANETTRKTELSGSRARNAAITGAARPRFPGSPSPTKRRPGVS